MSLATVVVAATQPLTSGGSVGEFDVGQVVAHVTDSCIAIYALAIERRFTAHNVRALDWELGAIVEFKLSSDGRFVESLRLASQEISQKYAQRRLIR